MREDTPMMTAKDREELLKIVRLREKVAKSSAAARTAELLARFEADLASAYHWDEDAVWRQLHDEAEAAVRAADQALAARCKQLGIPPRFRPSLQVGWYERGENASRARRVELRKVAETRLAAQAQQAKAAIEHASVEVQTEIVAGGLASTEARAFLERMPTIEALMPPLDVRALDAATPRERHSRWGVLADGTTDDADDAATA
jgi:hypothetical protein